MVGSETTRHCCVCNQKVYDLAAMEPDEADAFLAPYFETGGTLPCARIYRRRDRRVLAAECPAGERARYYQRLAKTVVVGAAGLAAAAAAFDVASRPVLGPDVDDEVVLDAPAQIMQLERPWQAEVMGALVFEPRRYDVDHALRSDEPMTGDTQPEGAGPARRRYVRPDPDEGIIHATTTLVVAPAPLNRRPRRHP